MLKQALAIRHIAFEDLGFFDNPLRQAGYDIRYHEAGGTDIGATDGDSADLLIVLGGPMGVYETQAHPYLADEIRLIERRIASGKPVLGVCLGAQLVASALGAHVYPGGVKEIGFAPIDLTEAGRASPLAAVAEGQPVLHWHGDTFDLPDGASLLASTPAYTNQAFSFGRHVLATQFHLEAGTGIDRWLTGHAAELAAAGTDTAALARDARLHAPALEQAAASTLATWMAGWDS